MTKKQAKQTLWGAIGGGASLLTLLIALIGGGAMPPEYAVCAKYAGITGLICAAFWIVSIWLIDDDDS